MVTTIRNLASRVNIQNGKIGYLILWLMGAPAGLLLVMYLFLGGNIFGPG